MNIPFFSFEKMNADVKDGMQNAFERVYDSSWYILGEQVSGFEKNFAAYCGTTHCAGVANGLDALVLCLKALGIGPGDEVIVPSNTYIATLLAVSATGAMPVPAEPDARTYNITAAGIQKALGKKTKAVIPVHLYGQACQMNEIIALSRAYGFFVVEDNAQAQGAACSGKKTGSMGHVNATSFYPGKNLGALGDAGAVTSSHSDLFERVKVLRNYGSEKKYYNSVKGINSRLDELQAAFLDVKLKKLDEWNMQRQAIAKFYLEALAPVNDLVLPFTGEDVTHVYHQFVVRTQKRDELMRHLQQAGIHTMVHYPVPPHLQEAYPELRHLQGKLVLAEELARTSVSLPVYPGLRQDQLDYITKHIRKFFK